MKRRIQALAIALPLLALAAEISTMEPKDLAARLQSQGDHPTLVHVGFPTLYRGKHIPQSIYAGPASRPDGLELLKKSVANLPRDRELVVYCGCCPWEMCPNIKPAMEALRQMGFTKVKAVMIAKNFQTDWTDHGYPVEAGEASK
ncbi:MAG TPA: rhodanese-like domain-containing protein [Bryobacteraceae bacterium]|nr:rhodanese-like domain-containing protein [Bryobacteraceae bacterium]